MAAFFIDLVLSFKHPQIIMPFITKLLVLLTFLMLISGCGGTYHAYYQSLKLGFSSPAERNISLEYVRNSAIDLMQIEKGDGANVILALAYIESGQHKWVSRDQAMLVLEQGRIVRTLGFSKNLIYLSDRIYDPLKHLSHNIFQPTSQKTWVRNADWDNDEYGYQISSTFVDGGEQTLDILSRNISTKLIVEELKYLAPTNFIRTNSTWKNYFWFETTSGELIKSIQLLSPLEEELEMVYLSRIARILANENTPQVNL